MKENEIKNSFCSPVSRSSGTDHSDDNMSSYELIEAYIPGPTKDDTDFVTFKKPKLVESWHQNKRVSAEAKGMDLKSIIGRFQKTGDVSLIQPREAVYGDETLIPASRSDQLQRAKNTEKYLDSLSASEKERLISLAKMSKDEFKAYIAEEVAKAQNQPEVKPEKEGE